MAFLGPFAPLFGLAGIAGQALTKKDGKSPTVLPPATRDDAAAAIARDDEMRRRKGGAADILNGATGTQSVVTGGKLVLGS